MRYPVDPLGPFGYEYPKGFLKYYAAIVLVVLVGGFLFLSGCSKSGEAKGDAILSHCAETADDLTGQYNEAQYQKCVDDVLWVLDEVLK